jgi:formylglycine-generating enzyme required for sulfatase activity
MKILILASNPRKDLRLDREIRDLKDVIERSLNSQQLEVVDELAVRVGNLQDHLFKHQPQIVHFCGHGSGTEGLVFEGNEGEEQWVRAEALSGLFQFFPSVNCVLLNACYSEEQAEAIVTHIDYVIGMRQTIRDDAAIAFSKGFYRALGYNCSIEQSYGVGCNAIQLEISGSSKRSSATRSPVSEQQRRMEVVEAIATTALEEHEKPILKKKAALIGASGSIPTETLVAIQVEVDKALEPDRSAPNPNWSRRRVIRTASLAALGVAGTGIAVIGGQLLQQQPSSVTVNEKGEVVDRHPVQSKGFAEDLGNGIRLEMVQIPGGKFLMGSPESEKERETDESPQHQVTVPSFAIGKFEVTQAQWKAIASLPKVKIDLNSDPSNFKGGDRPVEQVSWDEAVEFCDRLSRQTGKKCRLPSEAEWEYACRAGTTTPFSVGVTLSTDLANYNGSYTYGAGVKGEYRKQTIAVGNFPPNAFGLYGMHGNVWEWCADYYHDSYQGAPTDGAAWVEGGDRKYRMLRGGSWVDNLGDCRSAYRNRLTPDIRYDGIGFRVCLPFREDLI